MIALQILIGMAIATSVLIVIYRQWNKASSEIDFLIRKEAVDKKLKIISITIPSSKNWKDDPFDDKILVSKIGFNGFLSNERYYRIIDCLDLNSETPKKYWVKVTNHRKSRGLLSEWREQIK